MRAPRSCASSHPKTDGGTNPAHLAIRPRTTIRLRTEGGLRLLAVYIFFGFTIIAQDPIRRKKMRNNPRTSVLYSFKLSLLLVTLLLPLNIFAQYKDYTQLGLPKGAKARLGKGRITGDIAYSPEGTRLAIASSIGDLDIRCTHRRRTCPAYRAYAFCQ